MFGISCLRLDIAKHHHLPRLGKSFSGSKETCRNIPCIWANRQTDNRHPFFNFQLANTFETGKLRINRRTNGVGCEGSSGYTKQRSVQKWYAPGRDGRSSDKRVTTLPYADYTAAKWSVRTTRSADLPVPQLATQALCFLLF
jgi:hypothetical protein